jgi:hypothetical protein
MASTQVAFSEEVSVMWRLTTANINMQDPEKGYQLHHIIHEKIKYAAGIRSGDSKETNIKSQKPAQASLTSIVFALCKRILNKTKQATHNMQEKHPKHTTQ